ncbi:MAG: glycosyltransferase [Proteobacteria bacterium]|nr:glycosyltransferase [Pseudomonadota bacterium]
MARRGAGAARDLSRRSAVAGTTCRVTPSIDVIVPSYRRATDLARCLAALARQEQAPARIIAVARADDAPTLAVIRAAAHPVQLVTVTAPGVVAALNAGLDATAADLVAFTDDDAAPRPDWTRRLVAHFVADPGLGGVGGRDFIHQHGRMLDGAHPNVGRISWFGRCVGNHHLGVGAAREVDVLKGVNMSFRRAALGGVRFDERLLGGGAQVSNELGVSLAVKRAGWRLLYDPAVAVDHFPAARHDEDQRDQFSWPAVHNAAFNEALLITEHLGGVRRTAFLVWALALGHRGAPGFLQWLRLLWVEPQRATRRFTASLAGRIGGWRAAQ